MPSLWSKWACPTLVLHTQSLESKSQERSALTSKLWHKTSNPVSGSMALGSISSSLVTCTCHLASQHQRPQQRFVPANHSGKSKIKSKHSKRLQKVEDDQYYREPPIWMQSMMEWMGQQMKSCQQPPTGRQAWVRKNGDVHPMRGNLHT